MSQCRKVTYARLHEAYQQPGSITLGAMPKVLNCSEQKDLEMWYTSEGLQVSYKGAHFIIPLANVVGATFAKEEAAVASSKVRP